MNPTQLKSRLGASPNQSTIPAQTIVLPALLLDIATWRQVVSSPLSLDPGGHGCQLEVESAGLGLSKVRDCRGAAGEDSKEKHRKLFSPFDSSNFRAKIMVSCEVRDTIGVTPDSVVTAGFSLVA